MALGICEAWWLKRLLQDLGYPLKQLVQLLFMIINQLVTLPIIQFIMIVPNMWKWTDSSSKKG